MTITELIGPHLPFLRRFARALSGTQESGDAYVVSTLEALVEDQTLLRTDLDGRVALYQIFLKIWNISPINDSLEPSDAPGARLEGLTPKSRQAFLLTAVEGFSTAEAATILDIDAAGFETLLDQAGREIAEQVATDVLVIEDEPIIAMDLEALVQSLGHRVTDIARTHKEALLAVKKHRPGLVLCDIQLADGSSGLDAINDILRDFYVPVIFITAYPERLLTGSKPEPAFLITKPFQPNTLKAVISQALFFSNSAESEEDAA